MNYLIQTWCYFLAVSLLFYLYSKNKIMLKIADELSSLIVLIVMILSIFEIKNPFFVLVCAINAGWACVYIYNNPFYFYNFLFKKED